MLRGKRARKRRWGPLSAAAEFADLQRPLATLRRSAQLTPALVLRAILSRNLLFAEAALAEFQILTRPRGALPG